MALANNLMNNSTTFPPSRPGKPLAIKAVLFDLDDTLWPIVPVIARAEQLLFDWMREHAPAVTSQFTIESLRQQRLPAPIQKVLFGAEKGANDNAPAEELARDYVLYKLAARHAVTLFDDVEPVLARLQQRHRLLLGTVSNGFADLDKIGLARHFQTSIAAHSFGCAKPDPSIFQAACAALNVTPEETVYAGDDPLLDVVGAQQAGLRAVWINRFDRVLPAGVSAQASCTSLHELEAWLEQTAIG